MQNDNGIWNPTLDFQKGNYQLATTKSKVGVDATGGDPFWELENEERNSSSVVVGNGVLRPLEEMITPSKRWASATKSPKGTFITRVSTEDAFKNFWKFVKKKNTKEAPEDAVKNRLMELSDLYRIKDIHTSGWECARIFGKSLVFRLNTTKREGRRHRGDVKLRVSPVFDYQIEYNNYGEPESYNLIIKFGNSIKQAKINWKDAVLYVNKPDPLGNGYQGTPETYSVYNQLKWMANMEMGWATAMTNRGTAKTIFKIPSFEIENRDAWRQAYGDPSTYDVIFVDENTDVQVITGSSSFDLKSANDAWTQEVASSSGMAQSRIDGTQRGQVTGSVQDSDNYYQVLNGMQEKSEPYLIELYEMLDPNLEGKFDIEWDVEPKLDKQTRAQIDSIIISNAQMGEYYYTYNEILESLGKKPVPDGDMIAAEYNMRFKKLDMELEQKMNPPDNGSDKPNLDRAKPNKQDDRNIDQQAKKGAKQTKGSDEVTTDMKRAWVKAQFEADNSTPIRKMNEMIRAEFGEGLNPQDIVDIRKEFATDSNIRYMNGDSYVKVAIDCDISDCDSLDIAMVRTLAFLRQTQTGLSQKEYNELAYTYCRAKGFK